uniref:Uncharacterized protein n=1 Tax=Anopheles dirus TaxID=7168 RepID=A0A182N0P7_9DIPT
MTMWQSGGMGHGSQNNPWMKLMGIVHKERRHDNTQSQSGSNDRALNIPAEVLYSKTRQALE